MLTQHIALVAAAGGVNPSDLARVSAALQKQIMNELGPLWGVTATVDGFPQLEDVPTGYWPIVVGLPELGLEAGVHLDENGQPYALVELTGSWSFEASRACLEILVNPFGDRTVIGPSPRADQGTAEFVVEVCGPCGDPTHAYPVNGILVSDFCTPAYYGAAARDRVTFRDALSAPFELPRAGRLVWRDAITNKWWLRTRAQDEPVDTELGVAEHGLASLRELVRAREPRGMRTAGQALQLLADRTRLLEHQESLASRARAYRLRALLARRLLRGPERAPVLLTEQRVRPTNGRAPIGILPQERLEVTAREAASWFEDDPEGAAFGLEEARLGPNREVADEPPQRTSSRAVLSAKPVAPEAHAVAVASTARSEFAPPAPAEFPSIAPVLTAVQPVNAFEQRTRWLAAAALAVAGLFVAFGLGGRFRVGPEVQSPGSPAQAAAAPAAPAPAAVPQETLPTVPEPPSVALPAPAAAQPNAVAPAVAQPPSDVADVRAQTTDPDQYPLRKRQSTASANESAQRVGARRNPPSIEELIETRR